MTARSAQWTLAMAFLVGSAAQGVITLEVGTGLVNGTIYRPNLAGVITSTTLNGRIVRENRYQNDLVIDTIGDRPVFRLFSRPNPDGPDQQFFSETVLDYRSLEILSKEDRDGSGRLQKVVVDGRTIRGTNRPARDSATEAIQVTLDSPSYLFSFVDAAIGATAIRVGNVYRAPTFELSRSGRKTSWHTYRVAARDTIGVHGRRFPAWRVEMEPTDRFVTHTIYLMDDPPYLPLVVSRLKDGSVRKYESWLIERPKSK